MSDKESADATGELVRRLRLPTEQWSDVWAGSLVFGTRNKGWQHAELDNDAADLIERQAAEIERLNERLENNHVYNTSGERVDVCPGSIPDGISCRDETIKGQDEMIRRLRSELATLTQEPPK